MHSSKILGTDFKLELRGKPVSHAGFFTAVPVTERVGIITPQRFEGLGAITLIMAYVTAFYDRYRKLGPDFYAYPDFFTFQCHSPCADYGMCDIWPQHKNVVVDQDAQQIAEAFTDRGVTVLLVPDADLSEVELARDTVESARRSIRRCFAYAAGGLVEAPDLTIECRSELLREFAQAALDSVPDDDAVRQLRGRWLAQAAGGTLRQSFRELELSEALRRLA